MVSAARTILVVEDDAALRHVLAEALKIEDYRVIESSTATDALALTRESRADLILLDLGLPGHGGTDVLEHIKGPDARLEIPVVIMTGYALVLAGDAIRRADAFLEKPFDLDDLLELVSRLVDRHSSPSRYCSVY